MIIRSRGNLCFLILRGGGVPAPEHLKRKMTKKWKSKETSRFAWLVQICHNPLVVNSGQFSEPTVIRANGCSLVSNSVASRWSNFCLGTYILGLLILNTPWTHVNVNGLGGQFVLFVSALSFCCLFSVSAFLVFIFLLVSASFCYTSGPPVYDTSPLKNALCPDGPCTKASPTNPSKGFPEGLPQQTPPFFQGRFLRQST